MTKQPYLAANDASSNVSLSMMGSNTKCTNSFFFLNKDCIIKNKRKIDINVTFISAITEEKRYKKRMYASFIDA